MALRRLLAEIERLDLLARDSRRLVDEWEKEGAREALVEGRRKLAAAAETCRGSFLRQLWTVHGLKAPPGITLDHLRIVG